MTDAERKLVERWMQENLSAEFRKWLTEPASALGDKDE